jgi:hypothetical protein
MIHFRIMQHTIYIVLFISLFLIACDGNDGKNNDDCVDVSGNSNFIEDNIDCPADAVVQICTGFRCDFEQTNQSLSVSFGPSDCVPSTCFDFSCDSSIREQGTTNFTPVFGEYTIETVSGNLITGTVLVTDEETDETTEFNFSCSPLVI